MLTKQTSIRIKQNETEPILDVQNTRNIDQHTENTLEQLIYRRKLLLGHWWERMKCKTVK